MNRYLLLLKRFITARSLGFTFVGTTKTKLPLRARLASRVLDLVYPCDSAYMSDIINVWLDDEYGMRKVEPPNIVVDIGGNIGLFSLWAYNFFPASHIYAFEPNLKVYDYLKRNLSPTRAETRAVGVSYKQGRAVLKNTNDSRLATTTLMDSGEIELISLSQIVEHVGGKIDLLKMDCEGGEWDIFKDVEAFKGISNIRMEYHLNDFHSIDTLKEITAGLGYSMERLAPNRNFGIAWFKK
jgi:FkbM family methyltransferase